MTLDDFRMQMASLAESGMQQSFFLVQTKMSWRSLLISQYSRWPLGIKVQSCPALR